ncbi:hypothetical protein HF325_000458 [Metschnikowia pulcherrima]|uniref:Uncharacterized protein n=1 Tax=Metschnikowia pulcherrima TaxID=27326 RepID=A0A8H7GZB1_9ASCO|nr:hypothetical protein HF325_000458 [Metschnikowia pulcherrima]
MFDTTEPVATKETVECFRKFSFRLETYPILGNGDFVYQFDAAESAPQQIIEPFDFTEHIPFCPERNELSFIPEF